MADKSVSVEEMRQLEQKAFERGTGVLELMERAGKGCADIIRSRLGTGKKIVIFCGPGNNGGDGLVCARHLLQSNVVKIVLATEPKTEAAKTNLEKAKEAGIQIIGLDEADDELENAEIVVDALLGIGAKGSLRPPISDACRKINSCKAFKIAIDVPSGVDADSGEADADAVRPDATICIQAVKKGVTESENSGELWIVGIGL